MTKKTRSKEPVVSSPEILGFYESAKGYKVEYVVYGSASYTKDGSINLTIKMSHIEGDIPFLAKLDDSEEHGVWLYNQALSGSFGEVVEWERPTPSLEDFKQEFDKVWPDVALGLATEEEIALAKNLRVLIKNFSK